MCYLPGYFPSIYRRKLVYIMKCGLTILALILLYLQVTYSDGFQCPEDQYTIVDENGNKIECLACAKCTVGRGLRFPCGKKLTEAQKANIECIPCVPGKTYSDQHGVHSCKSCQICPVTMKNCTVESNTHCSRDCRSGLYYDNVTYNCQQCSYCCRKDNKRIAECSSEAAQSQCSVHDAQECSPKTTMNPTSSNPESSGDNHAVMQAVIGGVIGAVVLVLLICLITWLIINLRRRDHTPVDQPEVVPLDPIRTNNCGLSKSSFSIMVDPPLPPGQQKVQEDKQLLLICNNHDNQDDNCHYTYEWKKDMTDLRMDLLCQGKRIEFDAVQVQDFGKYTCHVKCQQHSNQNPVEAVEFPLDVVPVPPRRYKKFSEIKSREIYDKIGNMLNSPPHGIGDWKRVAEKYEMDGSTIQGMNTYDRRGANVVEYILAAHNTGLTVYEFCKFMKVLKQNQIVELLINNNHLTCEEQEERPSNARDSGYCPDNNGARSSLVVDVQEQAKHNPGLVDSREGSRDQLASTSQNGKEIPDKSNRKLDRQTSNQSAKSSGSGSGSASNSLGRRVIGLVRQISQNSSAYKMHDNENEDPS